MVQGAVSITNHVCANLELMVSVSSIAVRYLLVSMRVVSVDAVLGM